MRICILERDYPAKYNKVAKYIGRHWPHGPLKLNQSTNLLAKLCGYNNIHEIARVIAKKKAFYAGKKPFIEDYTTQLSQRSVVRSMAQRALKLHGIPLDEGLQLFTNTPWHELTYWHSTWESIMKRSSSPTEQVGTALGMELSTGPARQASKHRSRSLDLEVPSSSIARARTMIDSWLEAGLLDEQSFQVKVGDGGQVLMFSMISFIEDLEAAIENADTDEVEFDEQRFF